MAASTCLKKPDSGRGTNHSLFAHSLSILRSFGDRRHLAELDDLMRDPGWPAWLAFRICSAAIM